MNRKTDIRPKVSKVYITNAQSIFYIHLDSKVMNLQFQRKDKMVPWEKRRVYKPINHYQKKI